LIHHVFNSSLVSGPERLVLPNLQGFPDPCEIVLLQEGRRLGGAARVAEYAGGLGFRVHEFPVASRLDLAAVRALRAFWAERTPGIIHAHGPKAAFHVMLALRKWRGRPWFLTTHHGVRANDQWVKLRFFEALYETVVIPRTDLCLTVCTSDRTLLISRGVRAEKLAVHLNGITRPLYSGAARLNVSREARHAWFRDLGVDLSGAFLVGVVGRLSPEKQHGLILRSFARFRADYPSLNVHLLCFGSGPLEALLARRTGALGLDANVHWMGYRPDVSTEITGLDVLLSISRAEGLPINLLEAGWAGVPIIASAVDGVRDLIQQRVSGLLLEPPATVPAIVEAIRYILGETAEAERMAERLQASVRARFSREAWTERLIEIYAGFPAGA
jgi:glycosyltransferase involved in cell wall biosynthesis